MAAPISHDPAFWASNEALKKAREVKLCLAASHADPCQPNYIAAHTVPRSQLQHIAENGHVYSFHGDLPTFQKTQGELSIVKRGIRQFSTLNCFCGHHDVAIFSPVENQPLTFSPEQIAILHYRAVASEVYRKMTGLTGFEKAIAEGVKSKHIRPNAQRDAFAAQYISSTKLGITDIGRTFKMCEDAVYQSNFGEISALVTLFNKPPTIMSVGAFSPQFDYWGKQLQDLSDVNALCDQVALSILAAPTGAAVVMTWVKTAGAAKRFAETFAEQQANHLTTLSIQTAFEHLENTCMKISWWDSLKEVERGALQRRMSVAASFARRNSNALSYCGVTFDDWGYERSFFL